MTIKNVFTHNGDANRGTGSPLEFLYQSCAKVMNDFTSFIGKSNQ